MFLGLRTQIYHTPDLPKAKAFYQQLLGTEAYFDQPFYVGFNVAGYELGLIPDDPAECISYWGVANMDQAIAKAVADGATLLRPAREVGEGIRVAVLTDPFGNALGFIENPHFKAS
jgi:predicted enzyme related to lactoylglutathione lyase